MDGDIYVRCGTPAKRMKVVSIDVRFASKLIGYHRSTVHWATAKQLSD